MKRSVPRLHHGDKDFLTLLTGLKHYTSKLRSYEDLDSLNTFGFRGEALSSLCALAQVHIVTARRDEAPKGTKLEFDISGRLKSRSVTACQKGTNVVIENLFYNLPVRRRELEKNIKREYSRVISLLHAYACVSTNVRFVVSNLPTNGLVQFPATLVFHIKRYVSKKSIVFSTKANATTKENIANVYGAKTLNALIPLDLSLQVQTSVPRSRFSRTSKAQDNGKSEIALIKGHISRPVFGDGRQAPDRQMFFVNSRPCGLPQISRAFNEVYKSYNITQSPFIFADIQIDSNAYDVNVSPDKRTILLHEQNVLLESLKDSLIELFENEEQTVPQSTLPRSSLATFQSHAAHRSTTSAIGPHNTPRIYCQNPAVEITSISHDGSSSQETLLAVRNDSIAKFATRNVVDRQKTTVDKLKNVPLPEVNIINPTENKDNPTHRRQAVEKTVDMSLNVIKDMKTGEKAHANTGIMKHVQDFHDRLASQQSRQAGVSIEVLTAGPGNQPQQMENQTLVFGSNEHNAVNLSASTTSQRMGLTERPVKRRKLDSASRHTGGIDFMKASSFARGLALFSADTHGMPTADAGTRQETFQTSALEEDSCNNEQTDDDDGDGSIDCSGEETAEQSGSEERGMHWHDKAVIGSYQHGTASEYVHEDERKDREDAKIRELAETDAKLPTKMSTARANSLLSSRFSGDTIVGVQIDMNVSVNDIKQHLTDVQALMHDEQHLDQPSSKITGDTYAASKVNAEETLSLTISKADFGKMRIVGQFNLGFILATRPQVTENTSDAKSMQGDLFIIDQHASDEIYNFHHLSATTTLTPQPLVRPHVLELTAIEEETILGHGDTLEKNGFTITIDASGMTPVGRRCTLLTLPTSRETVFDLRDLEELLALLGEAGAPVPLSSARDVVRPSRVRKMLAMRACRSSVMVGTTLTQRTMRRVVNHMGAIERPWNCPHGRPTMRHLAGLGQWVGWQEECQAVNSVNWKDWLLQLPVDHANSGASSQRDFEAVNNDDENQ